MNDGLPTRQSVTSLRTPSHWLGRIKQRVQTLLRLRWLYLLRAEIRFAPTEAQRLFGLTLVIGVVCGFAAVAFHVAIRVLEHQLIDRAMSASGYRWIAWTLCVPTFGALLCGVLLEWVFPDARGSGVPQVKVAFAAGGGRVKLRDAVGKFIVGSLQIGSGSSLGREGPTVQICAGLASTLGRFAGVSPKSLRRLLPVGAAAGIAAAFNAPIAAVTFTVEEVVGNLDQAVLSGVIVAAALAAVIERSVLGENPVFAIPQTFGLRHASSLLVYALIGVAAAAASHVFTEGLLRTRARFKSSRIPRWARPALGGLVTGSLAVLLISSLRTRGVTGGGYEALGHALTGSLGTEVMLALFSAKIIATIASYSSGGAGGIFAPALFIGGMLGGAMGSLDQSLLGHQGEPIGAFALVGMGAAFSGIIRAPITSVLIIVEMTGGYSLILPLMIANMSAYILARRLRPTPIYEALLAQDGIALPAQARHDLLDGVRVDSLINRSDEVLRFFPATCAADISRTWRDARPQDVYPVLDERGRLLGLITENELRVLEREPDLLPIANAADLMRPAIWVRPDDDLRAALESMIVNGVRAIPVADEHGQYLGILEEPAIAQIYLQDRRVRGGG